MSTPRLQYPPPTGRKVKQKAEIKTKKKKKKKGKQRQTKEQEKDIKESKNKKKKEINIKPHYPIKTCDRNFSDTYLCVGLSVLICVRVFCRWFKRTIATRQGAKYNTNEYTERGRKIRNQTERYTYIYVYIYLFSYLVINTNNTVNINVLKIPVVSNQVVEATIVPKILEKKKTQKLLKIWHLLPFFSRIKKKMTSFTVTSVTHCSFSISSLASLFLPETFYV
ncbi:hypothetical protein, unlikely [Trypanosoma brucei gambiense DAL972]|uniref:Uncharacterized protein n=1 Tax=Trypanosoma brucei gambiense (strain MHOM/CI/86/DAL972) TaxID=679716 RepID=C9ZK41_TRYB9|nr:hypothetical protein, unlikely [Trypanosoma brucei gambiense DAL972]CBH09805.1 hypothetical protein, unlikely [Trypanosoma brucei gambiense DAL972]|eukprot:XP_011772098.1 hypothetical protein, unlikely [Trypanosoma brucei gambiense DAL972]